MLQISGVEHFFIYNTAYPAERQQDLQKFLFDYITEGVVSLVPWPYLNCVRGMASGRITTYTDPDSCNPEIEQQRPTATEAEKHKFYFHPPFRITQSSALASCYTRFRHTSTYIAAIDDDEFLKISSSTKTEGKLYSSKRKPLVEFIDKMVEKFPDAPAFKFSPVMMRPCASPDDGFDYTAYGTATGDAEDEFAELLPRLGRYPFARLGMVNDGKMVLRTEMVDMFFVHYLTALAKGVRQRQSVMAYPRRAVLLHYKSVGLDSAGVSGMGYSHSIFLFLHLIFGNSLTFVRSIFAIFHSGRAIPLNLTFEVIEACNNTQYLPLVRSHSSSSSDHVIAEQQRRYTEYRDIQQRQLMRENPVCFGTSTMAECLHVIDAFKGAELEEKDDFRSHSLEAEFVKLLLRNVKRRKQTSCHFFKREFVFSTVMLCSLLRKCLKLWYIMRSIEHYEK